MFFKNPLLFQLKLIIFAENNFMLKYYKNG